MSSADYLEAIIAWEDRQRGGADVWTAETVRALAEAVGGRVEERDGKLVAIARAFGVQDGGLRIVMTSAAIPQAEIDEFTRLFREATANARSFGVITTQGVNLANALERPHCDGPSSCHGPQTWCDACGDVFDVCDDEKCERHPYALDYYAEGWRVRVKRTGEHLIGLFAEHEEADALIRSMMDSEYSSAVCEPGSVGEALAASLAEDKPREVLRAGDLPLRELQPGEVREYVIVVDDELDPKDCERHERTCRNCGRGLAHDGPCPPLDLDCDGTPVAEGEAPTTIRTGSTSDDCDDVDKDGEAGWSPYALRVRRSLEAAHKIPEVGLVLDDGYQIAHLPFITTRARLALVRPGAFEYAPVWADRWEDALRAVRETGIVPEDCRAVVPVDDEEDDVDKDGDDKRWECEEPWEESLRDLLPEDDDGGPDAV